LTEHIQVRRNLHCKHSSVTQLELCTAIQSFVQNLEPSEECNKSLCEHCAESEHG
jgi:hypothetical protein